LVIDSKSVDCQESELDGMMMKYIAVFLLGLGVFACASDSAKDSDPVDTIQTDNSTQDIEEEAFVPLAPPPEGEGFQLSMEYEAPPNSETWICDIYPLPTTDFSMVNWVELQQTPGTHHLTLSTLGLTPIGLEPGRYDCNDLYGENSLMEDQIMFYGNQGDGDSTMLLPEGIAATLPPALDVIHEMHFVNVTDEPISVFSRLNAWTIPAEEYVEGIWGGSFRDEHIEIPPFATHTEWSRCVMTEDVEVLFVASHTHEKGVKFTVAPFDGETTGDIFYINEDWHVPMITQYEPPMIVPAGQGFEWSCTWDNPTGETVNYGLDSTDEMCNLALVYMPFSMTAECEVVETSDGVLWKP